MARANRVFLIEPDPFIGIGNDVASYIPDYNYVIDKDKLADFGNKYAEGREHAAQKIGVDIEDIEVVSRPINGFSAKPNTHAFVQVITNTGKTLKVFNRLGQRAGLAGSGDRKSFAEQQSRTERSSALIRKAARLGRAARTTQEDPQRDQSGGVSDPNSTAWTDWLLTSVREERVEKTQIVETFGADYLYAFGEKPRSLAISGVLYNTTDFNWRATFWENWDKFFRATMLIKRGARMYIGYDDILVAGYPINAVANQTADSLTAISFSFTFYVTSYINLSARSGFRAAAASNLPSIRSGFREGTAQLRPTRSSLIELLNFYKTNDDQTTAKLLARAAKGAFAVGQGEANAMAFIRAFTFRTTQDFFSASFGAAIRTAEDTGFGGLTGRLKRGEINAWFGYLGSILETMNTSSWDGLSGEFNDSKIAQFFMLGSVDRIVDAMAYNVTGLVTQFLPAPRTGAVVSTSVRNYKNNGGLGATFT